MSNTEIKLKDSVIGENTAVRLSLVLVAIGIFLGILVGAVWWAATIQSNVTSVGQDVKSVKDLVGNALSEMSTLRTRLELVDKTGTEQGKRLEQDLKALTSRINGMEREINSRSRNP